MKTQIPMIKGDTVGQDAQWTDALPQNIYAVDKPIFGADGFITVYPGLVPAGTILSDPNSVDRGAIWVSNESFPGQYRVLDNSLVKVVDAEDELLDDYQILGDIPGDNQVRMTYSFNNLAIVADGKLFYYNPADGVRQITDPDIGDPIDITWGDNVFILTDGVRIYHSNILDEEEYDPLAFTEPQFQPDPSLGVSWNEKGELMAFGALTIQYYGNVGGDPFLFRNISQKSQKIGIAGTLCKAYYGNTYYTLGARENSQFGVYTVESGRSQKISSITIDKLLATYSPENGEFNRSKIEVVDFEGTTLILVHLPRDVLCFNASIAKRFGPDNAWSKLTSSVPESYNEQIPHRAYNYIHDKDKNRWYCGDKLSFAVMRVDFERGDQVGFDQEHIFYSPFVKLESLSVNEIEIETVPGVGVKPVWFDEDGAPLEDKASLFYSRTDDGRVYSKEYIMVASSVNVYDTRYILWPSDYVRNFAGFRFRGFGKTRMSYARMTIEAS